MHSLNYENKTKRLVEDFKNIVEDAEALLKATADQTGELMTEIRAKAEKSLSQAKEGLSNAQDLVVTKSKAAAKSTDDYVHENTWISIGTAVTIGVVIGILISRK